MSEDKRKNNKGIVGVAGRKKEDDPKKPVTVYVRQSRIDALGGIEKAREIALKVLQ